MKNLFKNSMLVARSICSLKLKEGDTAADCTMGNGNDTEFLCSLVGEKGKVYAFDIQEAAVENTRERLIKRGFLERAELICNGHEKLDKYIKEEVNLFIYNLGYLPKGDHEIITKKETTIEAVKKSMKLLEENGIILLVVYYGHEGGEEEKEALENFVSQINQKEFNVTKMSFMNQINNPPELISIEKVLTKK